MLYTFTIAPDTDLACDVVAEVERAMDRGMVMGAVRGCINHKGEREVLGVFSDTNEKKCELINWLMEYEMS